ncbi:single-stranded DNA-binding protein [Lapillicoccus jejuensis]|uniref:Single-stranded DNA-binding protein n=1 Tax=Lapillicoccus jejuensis TaxID=402171 RepID=A0A542E4N1_9MICO|nr:single-stranded DNA-binding protein [Lapillicoccus jejuensis]TQJ10300.1 single-stranded DNA-binding protein [Lapillicoccus jejuensis]
MGAESTMVGDPGVVEALVGDAQVAPVGPRVRVSREGAVAPMGRAAEGLLAPGVPGVNQVLLVGRVSTSAHEQEMPSGDVLVTLRLVVPRPASRTLGDRRRPRVPVDTIEIACWSAATRRRALRFSGGELVEVSGALRRRFYRAGAVALSRYEVEARSLRRVREVTAAKVVVGDVVGEAVGE